jgi:hypothetical protein
MPRAISGAAAAAAELSRNIIHSAVLVAFRKKREVLMMMPWAQSQAHSAMHHAVTARLVHRAAPTAMSSCGKAEDAARYPGSDSGGLCDPVALCDLQAR